MKWVSCFSGPPATGCYYAVTTSAGSLVLVGDWVTGTAYSFTVTPSVGCAVASFVEDRNGNKVTISSGPSSTTLTDTLGRTLTIGTGSPQSVQVPGLAAYEVTWEGGVGTNPSVGQTADSSNSNDSYCAKNSPIASYGTGSTGVKVIETLTLPNSQSYTFLYDSTTGLLKQITYPTGAWVKYTWSWNSRADHIYLYDTKGNQGACGWTYDVPAVTERQVSFDGTNVALQQTFGYTTNFSASPGTAYKTTTVTTVDEIASTTTVTAYGYTSYGVAVGPDDGFNLEGVVPVEYSITYEDGNNNVYRTDYKSWSDQALMTCASTTQSGITSRTDYSPGAALPWTNKSEWDWGKAPACGSGSSGTPLRQTQVSTTSFPVQVYPASYFAPYALPHFLRPTKVTTSYNGAQQAQTSYGYDGSSLSSGGTTVGRDTNYNGTSITARGNATSKSEWVNTSGGSLTWNYTYDDTGQETSMTDPNSHETQYSHADEFPACGSPPGSTDAYLTTLTDAKGFTQTFTYRYCDGQLNSSTDRNGQPTTYAYESSLNRLHSITYPDTGSTTHGYSNACGTPSSTSIVVNGSTTYTETATLDDVCHVTEIATSDPEGTDYTQTTYDGLGRVWKVSNPYRSTSDPSYGTTITTYDPLGRVSLVTYPDSNTASTSYSASGNTYCSTVTDPASKTRELCSNALGQLLQAIEAGTYTTNYSYDAFHFFVNQSAQTRTFTYDSLARLTSAANPESGTTTYSYPTSNTGACSGDPSDVCSRADARGITTTYAYNDGLNRLTSKTYSDGTPTASFAYDEPSVTLGSWTSPSLNHPKGRLTHTTTMSGSTLQTATVQDYDPMGRTYNYWQCTPFNCGSASIWQMTYTYDQAGDVWTWSHPAGFTLTNTISNARRITQISTNNPDGTHPANMAQNITYTAWGALSSLTNGCAGSGCTNTVETYSYNNRLQPAEIQLGTSSNLSSYYALSYNYSLPGGSQPPGCPINPSGTSGNNGDVIGYTYTDGVNSNLNHSTLNVYDGLNRLTCAQATGNSTYNLTFSYNQDGSGQYGNMTCSYNSYTRGPCAANTFNGATNRINSSGYSYDAAGDVLTDGTYGYTWDAEGRGTSQSGSGVAETTVWNALGQAVAGGSSSANWSSVFDPSGQWIGQYNSAGYWWGEYVRLGGRVLAFNSQSQGITVFLHKDMQTTTHMATGPSGSVLQDQVFYPWGQSWYNLGTWYQQEWAGLDGEDPSTGFYGSLSRSYSPAPGRWLTPDPGGLKVADPSDPQTWNMYAYVRNNPTTDVDPTGEACVFGITIFGSWFGGSCDSDSPPPSPPPPPPAPAVITPGTPQNRLASAQANVRSDPAYQPQQDPKTGATTTFCNLATCNTVESVGGPSDAITNTNGQPNLANTAAQQLPNSSQWHEVSPQDAQSLANQGVPVVAVQQNPGGHGHEVTVAPELMPGLTMQLYGSPLVNNVGARIGVMAAGTAFPNETLPVHYYAPNNNTPNQ